MRQETAAALFLLALLAYLIGTTVAIPLVYKCKVEDDAKHGRLDWGNADVVAIFVAAALWPVVLTWGAVLGLRDRMRGQ